jgi:hypothetical protein
MRASDELLHNVTLWVSDIGMRAAQLPTHAARAAFLAERYTELLREACSSGMDEHDAQILAQSCVEGAERVMQELLARGTPMAGGRA